MRHRITLAFILAATLLAGGAAAAEFKVVVHGSNPIDSITKDRLSDIFLKKLTRWDNGRTMAPVDQSERNPVREQFSRAALRKEVIWIEGYWQKMIFSGRATPPARLNSDAEVMDFIRSNPDAIGYVSDGATVGGGLKTIAVRE